MAKKTTSTRPGTFAPGNKASANRSLPRGRFITQRLIAMMHEDVNVPEHLLDDPKVKKERATRLSLFCRSLFRLALAGDMQALKYIGDRIEGTATQTVAFVPQDEADVQALEYAKLTKTHDAIKGKSVDELAALYAETLRAGTPTHGTA